MGRLPVELGVDVGASGQEQPVEVIEQAGRILRGAGGQDQGQAPRLLDRAHVVVAQREDLAVLRGVADRDADERTLHILSGMGMPSWAARAASASARWPSASSFAKMLRARTTLFWM